MNRGKLEKIASYLGILLVLIIFLFPIYWMISASFKPTADLFAYPPRHIFTPTIRNYFRAFAIMPLHRYTLNSIIVSVITATVALCCGTLAGYSLARFRFRGKLVLRSWILGTQLIPPIAVVVPLFILLFHLNLIGTRFSLILALSTFLTPFCTWMMSAFFSDLPREMEECAMVDGASRFIAMVRIALPLAAPALAATWILAFIFAWNNFIFALPLTSEATRTLPVALAGYETDQGIEWGAAAAAGVIAILPILIFAITAQKYLVRGLVKGAIKG